MRQKKEVPDSKIRKDYYQMSDGVYGLTDTLKEQLPNDEEANRLIKQIKELSSQLYKHLEDNYNWD